MADAKRCDVCDTHYDPLSHGFKLTPTVPYRTVSDPDEWDICSFLCLLRLAQRRNPAATATLSSNGDDLSALIQKLSLTMDVVVHESGWNPPDMLLVDEELFNQTQAMVEEMVGLVLQVQEPDASSSS